MKRAQKKAAIDAMPWPVLANLPVTDITSCFIKACVFEISLLTGKSIDYCFKDMLGLAKVVYKEDS